MSAALSSFAPAWQAERFDALVELIGASTHIGICAHVNPDGDALGSVLALAHIIEANWPTKHVSRLLADADDAPSTYDFLDDSAKFIHVADLSSDPDLMLYVDLALPSRAGQAEVLASRAHKCAVIDHHPNDEPFGDVVISRPESAATGVIIAEFAEHLGYAMPASCALSLLAALMTDSGCFQYQNANAEAFEVAAKLVSAGASPARVSLNVYQSFRLEYLQLKALVTSRIERICDGRVAWSYATLQDLARTGTRPDECEDLVDEVRSVAGAEVVFFARECEDGVIRGNLRSKSERDVSGIARAMGGGGHRAAAGFTAHAPLDEVCREVLAKLDELFASDASEELC